MKARTVLLSLARAIADECDQNAPFRQTIESILAPKMLNKAERSTKKIDRPARAGRRSPAVLDPVELAKVSGGALLSALAELDLEQLKDIVAQYGMDPSKLVMKWKDKQRVIERIIEVSQTRATKGDAFR